jgi:hypothetical protein
LILDFEFDQHLESHKHLINIIMWFRDMGCYRNGDMFGWGKEQRGKREKKDEGPSAERRCA